MTTRDHVMSASWWWEAVSATVGKECGHIEVRDAGGEVIASMPYQLTRRGPVAAMLMPELTQTCHLWTSPKADRIEALRALMRELRSEMRRRRIVMVQVADYLSEADKELLTSEGFDLEERVSYQIGTEAAGCVAARLYPDKRHRYKKACGKFTLDEDMTADELYAAIEKAYVDVRYPKRLFTKLVETAIDNGNGVILRARATDGSTAASVFLATDAEAAYYLTPAIDPAHKSDGANEWLTVQAIEYTLSRGMIFDFEGSMIPGIASSFRHYGGTPSHYTFGTIYSHKIFKWAADALTAIKKRR